MPVVTAISLVFLLAGYPRVAAAQTFYGSLVGSVLDTRGTSVAAAMVTLTSVATGEERKSTTDNDGYYHFVNLVPGSSGLKVTKDGFKQFLRQAIYVSVDSSDRIDATLALGDVKEPKHLHAQ